MSLDSFFNPNLSLSTQAFIRVSYGILLFATLLMTLPQSRWFFVSERYGGYAKSDPFTDRIQNPTLLPFILTLWFLCAAMIVLGYHTVWFGLINLLLCRYFFIHMRWKGALRGMGAPGFMAYWLAACIFFLEYSLHMDPTGTLRPVALLLFRLDFAAIMLSAGLYKLLCGYPKNEGMEYGMVNPWWGYWWRWYQKVVPDHPLFKTLNHLAYLTEILAAVLLVIPSTQFFGALLIVVSFLFIATQIRLGFLCEMVMVSALLYMEPGSLGDRVISSLMPATLPIGEAVSLSSPPLNNVLRLLLWGYILLLPAAHSGLYYNFLARRPLPGALQKALERYTNFFGMIIWRVFSIDVVNFFANIYIVNRKTGAKKLYSRFGVRDWNSRFRYLHVGEFICLASVFTTLKYYPSNVGLFQERLLRYAKTIPSPPGSVLLFEYMSIAKSKDGFEFVPAVQYVVDVYQGQIEEKWLDRRFSVREADRASPVHEATYPGSYAPLQASRKPALLE